MTSLAILDGRVWVADGSDNAGDPDLRARILLSDVPANSALPQISGGPVVGQTLSCSLGSWSGSPALARQWLRAGEPVAGQTAETYDLSAADLGTQIALEGRTAETAANARANGPPSAPPSASGRRNCATASAAN